MDAATVNLDKTHADLFRAVHGDDLTRGLLYFKNTQDKVSGDKARADTYENLNELHNANVKTNDPADHAHAIDTMGQAYDELANRGYISREQAAQNKNAFVTKLSNDWLAAQPPEKRLEVINATLAAQGFGGVGDLTKPVGAGAPPALQLRSPDVDIKNVDPRLLEVVSAGATHLPQGYRVQVNEGYNAHGHAVMSQHHVPGSGALDIQIIGPNGPIPNAGQDRTGLYTQLAKAAYSEMKARHPDLDGKLAWGGNFGTVSGGETPDLMHFDIGGDRGHFGRLAQLGAGRPSPAMAGGWRPSASDTRADKNFNPGNIAYGDWARSHGATGSAGTDTGHGVAVFASPRDGFNAMAALALQKYTGGKRTAAQLIAGDGGWTPGNYEAAGNVARGMGLTPNADLQLTDPSRMAAFQKALATQEGAPRHVAAFGSLGGSAGGSGGGSGGGGGAAYSNIDTRLPGLLPPEQIVAWRDRTESELSRQNHEQTVAAQQEKVSITALTKDDISSVKKTGATNPALTPERVEASYGPDARARFEQDRANAHDYYSEMNGIEQVSEAQMRERVNRLAPKDGQLGFEDRAKLQKEAKTAVDLLVKERYSDTAAAADRLPAVKAAAKGTSLDRPWSYTPLINARMAAQEQLGIPEDFRQPLTNAEAKQFLGFIQGSTDRLAAINSVVEDINGAAGAGAGDPQADKNAQRALGYVLRRYGINQELRDHIGSLLQQVGAGQPIGLDESRQFDEAVTKSKADAVTEKLPGTFPLPHDDDMAMLREDPAKYSAHFDETFGPGASATALGIGQ